MSRRTPPPVFGSLYRLVPTPDRPVSHLDPGTVSTSHTRVSTIFDFIDVRTLYLENSLTVTVFRDPKVGDFGATRTGVRSTPLGLFGSLKGYVSVLTSDKESSLRSLTERNLSQVFFRNFPRGLTYHPSSRPRLGGRPTKTSPRWPKLWDLGGDRNRGRGTQRSG